jgi:hypothetical protein
MTMTWITRSSLLLLLLLLKPNHGNEKGKEKAERDMMSPDEKGMAIVRVSPCLIFWSVPGSLQLTGRGFLCFFQWTILMCTSDLPELGPEHHAVCFMSPLCRGLATSLLLSGC